MSQLKLTGGARVGRANVTYPFAVLIVHRKRLMIHASVAGNMVFEPSQVISIEPYSKLPLVGRGVKITHRVASYKRKVIFWSFKDPDWIMEEIEKTGFLDSINMEITEQDEAILEQQAGAGFPLNKSFVYTALVVWNLLFLLEIARFVFISSDDIPMGIFILGALALLLFSSVATLISPAFRSLVFKPTVEFKHMRSMVIFTLLISLLMFWSFGVVAFLILTEG